MTERLLEDQILSAPARSWDAATRLYAAYVASIPSHTFLNYLITPSDERIPITLSTARLLVIPLSLCLLMAYLARRPGTWLFRIGLAPFAFTAAVRTAFGYQWTDERFNAYNFGSGLMGVAAGAKIIEWAFMPEGVLKIGETIPGRIDKPAVDLDQTREELTSKKDGVNGYILNANGAHAHAHSHKVEGKGPIALLQSLQATSHSPIGALLEAFELAASMRGIGWKFGSNLYVAPEWRDTTNRGVFARQTLYSLLVYFTLFDFVTSCVKLVPGVGTPSGRSIFSFGSNVFEKYSISTAINFATGVAFILGFEMVYQLTTLITFTLAHHHPSSWPPLFDRPWATTSLHEFWSKRWHQLLRQTFLIIAGYPLGYLFGEPGYVFGAFLGSGLFHYWALYAMGKGSDVHCILFFVLQAGGIALERMWRIVTGRRISGWPGRIWAYIWVVGGSQWCVNAWHERGFAGGMLIPPAVSPTQLVIFPLAARVMEYFRL